MSDSDSRPSIAPDDEAAGDDLRVAAVAFFPNAVGLTPVEGRPDLLRVETPGGSWGVHRWPAEVPAARVEFVHAVLRQLRDAGLDIVPAVAEAAPRETVLTLHGHHYDARTWLPGRPPGRAVTAVSPTGERLNLPAVLPAPIFTDVVAAVARFHLATVRRPLGAPAAPLDRVAVAVDRAWNAQRELLRPAAPRTPAIQHWLRCGERVLPAAAEALRAAPQLGADQRVIGHQNLWPAHVLFGREGRTERFTGLIGLGELALGSPLLDLAQIVTRFAGWTADAAEAGIAAYSAVSPLTPDERRLLPTVAALDLVAVAGRLLVAAYASRIPDHDRRPVDPSPRAGAQALVTSLETVTATVLRGDSPATTTRKWVRRPRTTPAPCRGSARSPKPDQPRPRSPRSPANPRGRQP